MTRILSLFIISLSIIMANAQTKINIEVNGKIMTATLASNASAEAFKDLFPITIQMSDYGNFEKVGPLPHSIVRNDSQMSVGPGDIVLYQGSNVCIYYGTNSWAFTRLGKIDDATATEIKSFLNGSTVNVSFSLANSAGIEEVTATGNTAQEVYDLSGRKFNLNDRAISDLPKGLYIINGKKTLIK